MWKQFYWPAYLVALVVFGLSFTASVCFNAREVISDLSMVPGYFALFGALYQIIRDYAAFEKAKALQDRNSAFSLGMASHMSNETFNKHVAFCESYLAVMKDGLEKMFNAGPSPEATNLANKLSEVRKTYCAWLSMEIENDIVPLEQALRKIGSGMAIQQVLEPGKDKSQFLTIALDEFVAIFANGVNATDSQKTQSAISIQEGLRSVLGISNLTLLRKRSLQVAVEALD